MILKNGFVLSGIENRKIFYTNKVIGTGLINSFCIRYLINKEKEFNPIVTKMYKSFKTGENILIYF